MVVHRFQQYIKGTVWILIGLIFAKFISLIIRMIIARLGVTQMGIYYLATYILKFAVIVSFLGFEAFIVRDIAAAVAQKNLKLVSKILKYSSAVILPFSIFISFVLFFSSRLISEWFNEVGLIIPIKIIAFILPFLVLLNLMVRYFRGIFHWKAYFFFENIGKDTLRLLATVIAFFIFGTITSIFFGYLIVFFILSLFAFFFVLKTLDFKKIKVPFDWKKTFSFTLPLYGAVLTFAALEWIDSVMVGRFLTVSDVGLYDTAFGMAWVLLLLPSASMTFLLPKIISLYQEKISLKNYYTKIIAWNLAGNGLLASIFVVFGMPMLSILFGSEFVGVYPSLVILSLGFWVAHSFLPARSFLYVKKRGKLLFCLALFAVLVNIGLNYVFITTWGLNGAAFATILSMILLIIGYVYAVYLDMSLQPFSYAMLVSLCGLLLVLFGWFYIKDLTVIYRFICSIFLFIFYIGIHLVFTTWRKDLRLITSLLMKKK